MAVISLPVRGSLVALDINLPPEQTSLVAQLVVSGAAAYARIGRVIVAPSKWAKACVANASAELHGGHERESKELAGLRRRLRKWQECGALQSAPGVTLDQLCRALLDPRSCAEGSEPIVNPGRLDAVAAAARAVLGHPIGAHSACHVCDAAVQHDWEHLLYLLDVPDAALRDLYEALVAARHMPRLQPVTGERPLEDLDVADPELLREIDAEEAQGSGAPCS